MKPEYLAYCNTIEVIIVVEDPCADWIDLTSSLHAPGRVSVEEWCDANLEATESQGPATQISVRTQVASRFIERLLHRRSERCWLYSNRLHLLARCSFDVGASIQIIRAIRDTR